MNLGYIRVSTDKQNVENQKAEILKYAQAKEMLIKDFIEIEISSKKSYRDRKINLLLDTLEDGDNLLLSELSRLGRSTKEVLDITEKLVNKGIILHFIKQGMVLNSRNQNDVMSKVMITLFGLFAELERDFVSQRTKTALDALKSKGITLGKPVGIIQKSKFDKDIKRILELLNLGLSIEALATNHLACKNGDLLRKFIKKAMIVKTNIHNRKAYFLNEKYKNLLKKEYNLIM